MCAVDDQRTYEHYVAWCKLLGVEPASQKRWAQLRRYFRANEVEFVPSKKSCEPGYDVARVP